MRELNCAGSPRVTRAAEKRKQAAPARQIQAADGRRHRSECQQPPCAGRQLEGTASRYITPLEGIQDYVGDDVRVLYSEGCDICSKRK